MKLFLTSKGLIDEKITESFCSFVEGRKMACIITTAALDFKEKNRNNVALHDKLKHLGFKAEFLDIEFENPDRLTEFQVLVISGGNPYYLLHHLKQSKADKILRKIIAKNTPLMGISAGLLVLMKNLEIIDLLTPEMNTLNLTDLQGLHVMDEIVVPHYDRFVREGKIQEEIIYAYEKDTGNEVIRLGEYQGIRFEEGSKKIIGDLMKY